MHRRRSRGQPYDHHCRIVQSQSPRWARIQSPYDRTPPQMPRSWVHPPTFRCNACAPRSVCVPRRQTLRTWSSSVCRRGPPAAGGHRHGACVDTKVPGTDSCRPRPPSRCADDHGTAREKHFVAAGDEPNAVDATETFSPPIETGSWRVFVSLSFCFSKARFFYTFYNQTKSTHTCGCASSR